VIRLQEAKFVVGLIIGLVIGVVVAFSSVYVHFFFSTPGTVTKEIHYITVTTTLTQTQKVTFVVTSYITKTTTVTPTASYEELKIVNCYISDSRNAIIVLKNTGTADVTIVDIYINGKKPTDFKKGEWACIVNETLQYPYTEGGLLINFPVGGQITIKLSYLGTEEVFTSGVVYEFTIKTAAGGSYPVTARAP